AELFEHRTIASAADFILGAAGETPSRPPGVDVVRDDGGVADNEARTVSGTVARVVSGTVASVVTRDRKPSDDPLVVVGMYARMPGAPSLDAFWKQLEECRDLITEVPEGRFSWTDGSRNSWSLHRNTHLRWGGFVDGVDEFDPLFFNIAPKEAELMD